MTAIGIALLVVGVIVVLIEAHVPSLGMLGGPGVVALAAGAVLAVAGLGAGIALGAVAGLLLAGTGIGVVGLSISKGAAVRKHRHRSGPIGRLGVVRRWSEPEGTVLVDGALWNARPSHPEGDEICEGDRVVVERVSGLTLAVRKAEDWELVA
jgi:membrane-bound ClpP family serine protease